MTDQQVYEPLVQACHELGIPYQRAWKAVVSGAVVAVCEGGRWKLPRDQREALLLAVSGSEADNDAA